ncbi:hypothetical protein C8R43DRAFT_1131811 [Mycena crocata]|nr:hypothetical protein C8R43DRAFT_1131811 [Mycena crocata]
MSQKPTQSSRIRAPVATVAAAARGRNNTGHSAPAREDAEKENNNAQVRYHVPSNNKNIDPPHGERARRSHNNKDNEEYQDNDEDMSGPEDGSDGDNEDNGNEDQDATTRSRARRPSAKQAQNYEDAQAAAERKAAKAVKAAKLAKKRALQEAGQADEEDLEPRPDNMFTSRVVTSRPAATKALAQRNSKVPPVPTFSSSTRYMADDTQSLRRDDEERYVRHSDSHTRSSDNRHGQHHTHRSRSPVVFGGRSPAPASRSPSPSPVRNINGGVEDVAPPLPYSRSPSPIIGEKRGPSHLGDDVRTVQAQKTTKSGGRPKAKDYDDLTQEVITLTIRIYRCYLSIKHGFPDHAAELEFLRAAFAYACRELGLKMHLTPDISKLITSRGSHLRGELKTKVKPMVEAVFGFKSGHNKKSLAFNRTLGETLKHDLTFTFNNTVKRKGIYKNGIIQMAVNAMWFANRRDEGPSFPEFFKPFPKPALALVLTVVENLIDEWTTGIRTDIAFTANEYRSIYENHLDALNLFEERTKPHNILGNILVRLHNIGRFHSGAQPITENVRPVLSRANIDAAIKEYEEGSETESDAEFGGDDYEERTS